MSTHSSTDTSTYMTAISHLLTLPKDAVHEAVEHFTPITRPEGISPQGFGYFVEFLVKWLLGYRKFPGMSSDRQATLDRLVRSGKPLDMKSAIDLGLRAATKEKFENIMQSVDLADLMSQIKRYLPPVKPDDALLARAEHLGHRERFSAVADLMTVDLIVDIKVCVRDEPAKWFQQTIGYGALFNIFYGGRVERLEIVNYFTGTVHRLNLKTANSAVPGYRWDVAVIREIDALLKVRLTGTLGKLLATPIVEIDPSVPVPATPVVEIDPSATATEPGPGVLIDVADEEPATTMREGEDREPLYVKLSTDLEKKLNGQNLVAKERLTIVDSSTKHSVVRKCVRTHEDADSTEGTGCFDILGKIWRSLICCCH